jgi:hypothetical protein
MRETQEKKMSTPGTNKVIQLLETSRARLSKLRESSKEYVSRGIVLGSGVGGGLLSGALRGMGYAQLPKTTIDTDLALGAAAGIAGVMGVGGQHSGALVGLGIGLAAPALSRTAEKSVREWHDKK